MSSFSLIPQTEPLETTRSRQVVPDSQGVVTRGTRAALMVMGVDPGTQFTGSASFKRAVSGLTDTSGFGYQEFLVQGLQVNLQEKVQVNQNFGDGEVLFFFGQSPVFVNVTGTLIDDVDNQWFLSFMESYQNLTRGSKLAKLGYTLKLVTASQTFEGTLINLGYSQDGSRKVDVPFQLQFLATSLAFNAVGKDLQPAARQALTQQSIESMISLFAPPSPKATLPAAGLQGGGQSASSSSSTSGGVLSTGSWYTQGTSPAGELLNAASGLSSYLTESYSKINQFLSTISKNVANISGLANTSLSTLLSPINSTIGEIRDISLAAESIVRQVVTGLQGLHNQVTSLQSFYDNTVQTFKDSAGYIGFAPASLLQNATAVLSAGSVGGASLTGSSTGANILSSSASFTAADGGSVSSSSYSSGSPESPATVPSSASKTGALVPTASASETSLAGPPGTSIPNGAVLIGDFGVATYKGSGS